MLGIRQTLAGCLLLAASALPAAAGVPVGTISLAVDFKLGTYSIQIRNLTGDPAAGGYALPPDYPVLTALTWQQASVTYTTIDQSGNQLSRTVALGTIAPGTFTSRDLVFNQSTVFQSITLSAVIVPGTFVTRTGTYTSPDLAVAAELKRQDGKTVQAFDSADVLVTQANAVTSTGLFERRVRPPSPIMANCFWRRRQNMFAL